MAFSKIHKTAEIEIPEGVSEDEVEIIGGACDARGQWDEGVESVVLKAAKKPETKTEGQAQGRGDEGKTTDPTKTEGTVTEPPRGRGRGKANDKPADKPSGNPADKPAEANAETAGADKPAETNAETAADKSAEKS